MVGTADTLATAGGVGVGLGSTLLIRDQFDGTGETSVLRPSVLWGVGTGLLGMGLQMVMDMMNDGPVGDFVADYSRASITAGVFSAFSPKGGGVRLPTA